MRLVKKAKETIRNIKTLLFSPQLLRYEAHLADLQRSVCESTSMGTAPADGADHEVVVSLTSYGRRIEQVHITIESLMRQTRRPHRIVLWLEEGLKDAPLPYALRLQQKRGLEIRYCEDLKSYKKLVPSLKAFPDAVIITVDDDVVYDCATIDRLMRGHEAFPGCVVCNTAVTLDSDTDYSHDNYTNIYSVPAHNILPVGVGGVLYPPHCLAPEVLDMESAMKLAPRADDIWFKAMALKQGTMAVRVATADAVGRGFVSAQTVQDTALWLTNVRDDRNRLQYRDVMAAYQLSIKR